MNKITFTGKEGCLNVPVKTAKKVATNYFPETELIPKQVVATAKELTEEQSAKLNDAYKSAFAPYIDSPQKTVNKDIDFNFG